MVLRHPVTQRTLKQRAGPAEQPTTRRYLVKPYGSSFNRRPWPPVERAKRDNVAWSLLSLTQRPFAARYKQDLEVGIQDQLSRLQRAGFPYLYSRVYRSILRNLQAALRKKGSDGEGATVGSLLRLPLRAREWSAAGTGRLLRCRWWHSGGVCLDSRQHKPERPPERTPHRLS